MHFWNIGLNFQYRILHSPKKYEGEYICCFRMSKIEVIIGRLYESWYCTCVPPQCLRYSLSKSFRLLHCQSCLFPGTGHYIINNIKNKVENLIVYGRIYRKPNRFIEISVCAWHSLHAHSSLERQRNCRFWLWWNLVKICISCVFKYVVNLPVSQSRSVEGEFENFKGVIRIGIGKIFTKLKQIYNL